MSRMTIFFKKFFTMLIVITLVLPLSSLLSLPEVFADSLPKHTYELFANDFGKGTLTQEISNQPEINRWRIELSKHRSQSQQQLGIIFSQGGQVIEPVSLEISQDHDIHKNDLGEWLVNSPDQESQKVTIILETVKVADVATSFQPLLYEERGEETLNVLSDELISIENVAESPEISESTEEVAESVTSTTVSEQETQVSTSETTTETTGETSTSQEESQGETTSSQQPVKVTTGKVSHRLAANPLPLSLNSLYSNFVNNQGYSEDQTGRYPKNSWSVNQQTSVKNYLGNNNGSKLNTPEANYLTFGNQKNNPDIKIRKYASETTTPGLYDVYLNVAGNTSVASQPTDVMFVVDHSTSMTNSRLRTVKNGVEEFIKQLSQYNEENQYRVGLYVYGGDTYKNISVPLTTLDKQRVVEEMPTEMSERQGTFTQQGLREGAKLLSAGSNTSRPAKKVMVLLTDGMPTFSYKINQTVYHGNFHDTNLRATSYVVENPKENPKEVIWGDGTSAKLKSGSSFFNPKSYVYRGANSEPISDHFLGTLSEAYDVKKANIEIHALGIEVAGDSNFSSWKVNNYMEKIASNGTDGKPNYYNAANSSGVTNYLQSISQTLIDTVSDGQIIDPLGEMVNLEGLGKWEVTSVGAKAVTNLPTVTYDQEKRTLQVNRINLSQGQEIKFHYQVRLTTEDPAYQGETFYPANGQTLFIPKGGSQALDFGVPSIKGPSQELTIAKEWVDDQLFQSSLRPTEISAQLMQHKQDGSKKVLQTVTLTQKNNWRETVKNLPTFDNQGKPLTYSVNEVNLDPNYQSQVKQTGNQVKLINTLRRRPVTLVKTGGTAGTKLAGAGFTLARWETRTESWQRLENKLYETNQQGTVDLLALPVGRYLLKETQVPVGYEAKPNSELIFDIQNSQGKLVLVLPKTSQDLTLSNEQLVLNNQLKAFDLTLLKLSASSQKELADAVFELSSSDGGLAVKEQLKTDLAGKLIFTNLKPGTYQLREIEAPTGYRLLKEPINWRLTATGEVELLENGQSLKDLKVVKNAIGNNQISLTVTNQAMPVLPNTGSYGLYLIIGSGLTLVVIAIIGDLKLRKRKMM
ncbi:vWA domain-containing protein [Vagococcus salmoninarum]|uniref:vWA domain-containing protein n=1 Tax=Vagococcus salmoninarum TaxID=2739 RepID=UPI00187FE54B|nr:vWA domain-containing protein [Vagococcus salmoninarum]MBE9389962.1 VWA domain-containing protein [Vagococcus salmoninarum]